MAEPDLLRLAALDGEDLAVVSAHAQDAVLKVGDLLYQPKERCFALAMNRFVWESVMADGECATYERRRTVLTFDRVLSVKASRIRRDDKDAVLELLAIDFVATDPPAGQVTLHFAGGGAVRLEVECIEARLADVGASWQTRLCPEHRLAEDAVELDEPAP